jgi:adenosylcobinamide-GDP ribazoletransferase
MRNRGIWWAPFIALQFLTRIPIRFIPDWAYDAGGRQAALIFFPLVGVIVGVIGASACLAARTCHLPSLACAIIAVAVTALTTGAFHEDGIADTFDAIGSHTRERALEIMRDSRIGTFGSIGLWVILALKSASIQTLPNADLFSTLICAHVLARWSSLPLARALPYARHTSGLGAGIAELISTRELIAATVIAAIIIGLAASPLRAVYFVIGSVLAILLTGSFYKSKFGGITGDCLGATNQIVEVIILLIGASQV